jgi:hypothetical protein
MAQIRPFFYCILLILLCLYVKSKMMNIALPMILKGVADVVDATMVLIRCPHHL